MEYSRLSTVLCLVGIVGCLLTSLGCGSSAADCACEADACYACEEKILDLEAGFESDYLQDPAAYHRLISSFHQASRDDGSAEQVLGQIDLYFDMSNGMYDKVEEAEQQGTGLLTDLINVVSSVGQSVEYFRLETGAANKLQAIQQSNVKTYVRTASNYNSTYNYAPLDTAVQEMVRKHDRQSVFITDGELAKKGIRGAVDPTIGWAVKPFTQWLAEGNRLDFIVMPTKKNERLFFIFFTPRKIANRDNSTINAFLEATANVNRDQGYSHLKFTVNDYRLEKAKDGRAEDETGFNSTFVYNVGYYSPVVVMEDNYEHIHIDDIQAFTEYVDAFSQGEFVGDFEPTLDEKNKIFYNLQLTNEFVNYQIANLDLKVSDMTQPLWNYMNFLKCQQADTAMFVDEEGNKQVFWCNPSVNCQDTSACQFDPAGGREIKEVFTLHEESVMKEAGNSFHTAAIAVKPVPAANFDINALYALGQFKIELFIKDVNYDPKKQDFDLLSWPYKGGTNSGLSESIRLAMQNIQPKNKLIYTYYVTFPAESVAL